MGFLQGSGISSAALFINLGGTFLRTKNPAVYSKSSCAKLLKVYDAALAEAAAEEREPSSGLPVGMRVAIPQGEQTCEHILAFVHRYFPEERKYVVLDPFGDQTEVTKGVEVPAPINKYYLVPESRIIRLPEEPDYLVEDRDQKKPTYEVDSDVLALYTGTSTRRETPAFHMELRTRKEGDQALADGYAGCCLKLHGDQAVGQADTNRLDGDILAGTGSGSMAGFDREMANDLSPHLSKAGRVASIAAPPA
ncbi:hypothetical protein BDK51DRAFT_34155 [Blyttiomyces helicus]|uniref:SGF29 C-terminal domain-containing protein n=1 Tax=Blyttiomyces helicus TaxID=388810 RepID=A0A4V1IQ24_9FUNG|nr:hypothetical protein BDK51DRAFT_34155 [Blyttiomyces helicus]|eukprot:RKO85067.1 hypothetical protein BDK51DRAFT_34155 [Blyttiomyces helicus]